MRRLLDLRPRPLDPSDRAWIALTVVLGIVGTCQAAPAARAERRATMSARAPAGTAHRAPRPPARDRAAP